jgi:hypothetical protein
VEKRAIIIVKLVSTPEAYEGKTNRDIAKEIQAEDPAIPYVAEIERTCVFNSPAHEGDTGAAYKQAVMEAFKPIHKALGPAAKHLANKDIAIKTMFDAERGYHIIVCEKPAKRR